jgi:predicted dehydrogenase
MRFDGNIGIGVAGLGYMGRTHLLAYRALEAQSFPCRVVAVCDSNAERLTGIVPADGPDSDYAGRRLFEPAETAAIRDFERLLSDDVHVISICTHTDTHIDLASRALRAGKHVLIEKPVALGAGEVDTLISIAAESKRLCMPALCMRFWPGYTWLYEHVVAGTFGAPKSALFERVTSAPAWGRDFYADVQRSGGALFDLHIHDVDFLLWCFQHPRELVTMGSLTDLTTLYRFAGAPTHASAAASWDHSPGYGFLMHYKVVFEEATVDFDLNRRTPLLLTQAGRTESVTLPSLSAYDAQALALLSAVQEQRSEPPVPLEAARDATRVIEAELRSLKTAALVGIDAS